MTPTKSNPNHPKAIVDVNPRRSYPAESTTPHDLLLTGSALGVASRLRPDTAWGRLGVSLARRPDIVAQRWGARTRTRVHRNRHLRPCSGKADKRFSDPAWPGSPLINRSMQAYLAAAEGENLFADAQLDWRDAEDAIRAGHRRRRARPSNSPMLSPLGWKAIIDTGGLNAFEGGGFPRDMASAKGSVDGRTRRLHVGEARSHTGRGRLPQRGVRTDPVHTANPEGGTVPLLMVPPVINKYYIMDIAPGRSMVEYFVRKGIRFSPSHGAIQLRHNGTGDSTRTAARSLRRWTRSDESQARTAPMCRRPARAESSPR